MAWTMKTIGEAWAKESPEGKAPYEEKQKKDKERYEIEFKKFQEEHPEELAAHKKAQTAKTKRNVLFKGTGGQVFKRKTKELEKKFEVPKKPLATHMLFCNDVRAETTKENPDAKMTEMMGHMMKKYNALDEAGKSKWVNMHEDLKKKYEAELKEFADSGRKAEYEKAIEELKSSRKDEMAKKKAGKKTTKKGSKKKGDDSDDDDDDDEDDDDDD